MRTLFYLGVFLLLSSLPVSGQIVDEVPREVARSWVALVDEGKYEESWKTASPLFQQAVSREDWVAKIRKLRKTWGKLKKREFVRGRYVESPVNFPQGDYFALEYRTEFENVKISELVVPVKDETGLWQVGSYSISTKTPQQVQ